MKKIIFLFSIFFPMPLHAQNILRYNHELPEYKISSSPDNNEKIGKLSRFLSDTIFNSSNINGRFNIFSVMPSLYINGDNGNLAEVARMADGSVQQIDANKPNGYLQIDKKGSISVSGALDAGVIKEHPIYNKNNIHIMSEQKRVLLLKRPIGDDVPLEGLHSIPFTDMLTLGGIVADDKMFFNVSGQPYGGGQAAVVDQVFMDGANIAQGTGVTAGPWANSLIYSNFDAAARGTVVKSSPPYFIASKAIKDPDGNAHSVTFTSTGAKFSPALPSYWAQKLRVNMSVATNEVGVSSLRFPTSAWSSDWSEHSRRFFNIYVSTLTGWHSNIDGTVDEITTDGWVVLDQKTFGLGEERGKIPGIDTLDGTKPQKDTIFTNIRDDNGIVQDAIFFGVYTKQFIAYDLCALDPQLPHGDINDPNGRIGSLVHECDHERDLWNHDPTDYVNSLHGMTITENNVGGGKLTDDSYLLGLQGGSAMPVGIQIWNVLDKAPIIQMFGNGTKRRHSFYSPTSLALEKGSYFRNEVAQYSLASQGNLAGTIDWTQYRDNDVSHDGDKNDWSSSSIHLQFKEEIAGDPIKESGSIGGQLVFNPPGYQYGLGLGAGGTYQNPNYGVIVTKMGSVEMPRGLVAGKFSYSSLGIGSSDGEQKWCVDCKLNGVRGLQVFWHSSISQWTDSQNHILKN